MRLRGAIQIAALPAPITEAPMRDARAVLSAFEVPPVLLDPSLRALRLANTALDALFYDTFALSRELLWRGEIITTDTSRKSADETAVIGPALGRIDLGALSNPEGCILVIDSKNAPFVTRFDRVDEFIHWTRSAGSDVRAITVTGVGSSALGSAAFAWNVAMAEGERVAAIVPGCGVADWMSQALGGWFGLGMHEWMDTIAHRAVAYVAPSLARIGHQILETLPDAGEAFESGNPASDVLHAVLRHIPGITLLAGHSKGALVIENALQGLDAATTRRLHVMTFGCPIDESVHVARYTQYLGYFDPIGWLNAWGNRPERRLPAHHSTNTAIPLSMPVAILSRHSSLPEKRRSPPLLEPPRERIGAKAKKKPRASGGR
jgi:hypothetical protein